MLTVNELRTYCLSLRGAVEDFPFGVGDPMVFKVMGKMFALLSRDEDPAKISLKCDPQQAEVLRATYHNITPGYYLNKQHWNTIVMDAVLPDDRVLEMIEESYHLVVKGLTKAQRAQLANE